MNITTIKTEIKDLVAKKAEYKAAYLALCRAKVYAGDKQESCRSVGTSIRAMHLLESYFSGNTFMHGERYRYDSEIESEKPMKMHELKLAQRAFSQREAIFYAERSILHAIDDKDLATKEVKEFLTWCKK
jgi:hypothetical protein